MEGYRAFRAAFPDVAYTLHEIVAQGDYVAFRSTLEGTHRAPFAGVPPTGKRVTLSGMGISRHVDGRIAEIWGCSDFLGFLQQLGALPASPATDRDVRHE
jgi:predicted ester cyclase